MKRAIPLIVTLSAIIVISFGCSKGGSALDNNNNGLPHTGTSVIDSTAPSLTINTPSANQVFTSGSTINITGRVTDDLGLYRGYIRIIDDATGYFMINQAYEIHYFLGYDFNINYSPNVTAPSNYTVTVFFEDHGYNGATKSVKIKVNP